MVWKESEIVNKQKKFKNGVLVGRGIEWTDYTWNPIGGCFHACQWQMPDGSIANCYAEDVADRVAQKAYLNGFEHHYWNPNELNAPMGLRLPSRIFVGSMADVFGHWVPDEQIKAVLDVALVNPEHTFQFLTKNPRRVLDFAKDIPANCWIGASTPPDFMWNRRLQWEQRRRMLDATSRTLLELREAGIVTWMSAEPLTIDIGDYLKAFHYREAKMFINWMVIGAASNGRILYEPDHQLVVNAVTHADQFGVKVFFKGNMRSSLWARDHWREEFPDRLDEGR